ncbi:MAG: hypothetical protein AAGK47_02370 [Bacteroidota bacterium]
MKKILFLLGICCLVTCLQAQHFNIVEEEPHYFFLIPTNIADRTEVGGVITQYNHLNYPDANLRIETVYLPGRVVAFQVQPFATHSAARAYYDRLRNGQSELVSKALSTHFFIVSRSNLHEILRANTIQHFLTFFRKNYH